MEKSTKSKKKKLMMNFNFSDDESEEDVFQLPSKVPTPVEDKRDYWHQHSQLSSFLEDIGPPIMDSTHVFTPDTGNDVKRFGSAKEINETIKAVEKACAIDTWQRNKKPTQTASGKENVYPALKTSNFKKSSDNDLVSLTLRNYKAKHARKVVENDHTSSYVEVEVQDCSIQTSAMHSDNSPESVSDKDSTRHRNVKTLESSGHSTQSSSSLSGCHNDLFSTALEDVVINPGQSTKSELCGQIMKSSPLSQKKGSSLEDSDSALSSHSQTSSSQHKTSYYYTKDISLQTSFSQTCSSITSDKNSNLLCSDLQSVPLVSNPTHPHPSRSTVIDQELNNKEIQRLSTNIGAYRTQNENNFCSVFGTDSPHLDSHSPTPTCVAVLAADSDEDIGVEKTAASKNDSNGSSFVIADSDSEEDEDQLSENYNNGIRKQDLHITSQTTMSDLQDSAALCLRWSQTQEDSSSSNKLCQVGRRASLEDVDSVTASLEALSFHQGHKPSLQRRRGSSSSEDDNFDAFLNKLKADQDNKKTVHRPEVPSMEDFIVDDNSSLSGEDPGSYEGGDDDDDGHLFYIKTDNERNRRDRKSRRKVVEKTHVYRHSSTSSEPDGSDMASFVVDDEEEQCHDTKPQSRHSRQDCHEESDEHSRKMIDESKSRSPLNVSSDTGILQEIEDTWGKGTNIKSKSTTVAPIQNTVTPSTGKGKKKKENDQAMTSGKKKLLPSSFTPAWSSDSDDDFVFVEEGKGSGSRTPSGLQTKSPALTTFKTPKPVSKSKSSMFETPVSKKGPLTHPWTAPRGLKHTSKSSPGEDDNTFFLKSLSESYAEYKRHPEAARFVKSFKSLREELTQKLFRIFNEVVFESKIPSSIDLVWNVRYRKTAGTFSYKRCNPTTGKITLSVKVCDRPERVRDTLVHELCHAAVRIINGANESHGPVWKSWARRVNAAFPFMPVVARCHDYIIHSKYTYQCVNCKYRIGRHSKSLDTDKKVCGHCKGEFQVFLTSELNALSSSSSVGSASATPMAATPRTPNRFAMFVKESYSDVKKRNADLKHGDIMRELSKEFAEKNKIQS